MSALPSWSTSTTAIRGGRLPPAAAAGAHSAMNWSKITGVDTVSGPPPTRKMLMASRYPDRRMFAAIVRAGTRITLSG